MCTHPRLICPFSCGFLIKELNWGMQMCGMPSAVSTLTHFRLFPVSQHFQHLILHRQANCGAGRRRAGDKAEADRLQRLSGDSFQQRISRDRERAGSTSLVWEGGVCKYRVVAARRQRTRKRWRARRVGCIQLMTHSMLPQ